MPGWMRRALKLDPDPADDAGGGGSGGEADTATVETDAPSGADPDRSDYEAAAAELLGDDGSGVAPARDEGGEEQPEEGGDDTGDTGGDEFDQLADKLGLTPGQIHVARRAGMTASALKRLSKADRTAFLDAQQKIQRDTDARMSKSGQSDEQPPQEAESEEPPADEAESTDEPSGVFDEEAVEGGFLGDDEEARNKIIEDLEYEGGPATANLARQAAAHFNKLETQLKESREINFMLVEEMALSAVASEYPSALESEGRERLLERFDIELGSGAYQGRGTMVQAAIEAMRNAAKIEFNGTSERTAKASLVKNSRDQIRRQPASPRSSQTVPDEPQSEREMMEQEAAKHLRD